MPRLVFFTIHSTTRWWQYLGSRIDFADVTVLSDLRGDGDRSHPGVGLRWAEHPRSVLQLLVLLDHLDAAVEQVDALAGQCQHLAESKSDERPDEYHGPEPRLDRVGDVEDLGD